MAYETYIQNCTHVHVSEQDDCQCSIHYSDCHSCSMDPVHVIGKTLHFMEGDSRDEMKV